MEAALSSETSVHIMTAWGYIPEDGNIQYTACLWAGLLFQFPPMGEKCHYALTGVIHLPTTSAKHVTQPQK
jgi:hypothetical protein